MSLTSKSAFDAIIIGGGIIGLAVARELKKKGVGRVAVLEKNSECAAESSAAAAGMLAPQAETNNADSFFDLCRTSRDLYPEFAAELLAETGVDIELDQTGTLYLAFDEDDLNELDKRFAWQNAAGLPVEKLNEWDAAALEPALSKFVAGALRFPLDWQTENVKISRALLKFFGAENVLRGEVKKLIFVRDKISGVVTDAGTYFAPRVVVASGAWTSLIDFPDNLEFLSAVVAPVRGQMLSFTAAEKLFRHVVYSPRGYVVPRRDGRILIGATVENAGFDNRTTGGGVTSLLETAFEISPVFRKLEISRLWSGLRPKSPDGLPLLGEFPRGSGLYFATGHYRNGILLAPLTAKLIAAKIADNIDSPFLQTFNPYRFRSSVVSQQSSKTVNF